MVNIAGATGQVPSEVAVVLVIGHAVVHGEWRREELRGIETAMHSPGIKAKCKKRVIMFRSPKLFQRSEKPKIRSFCTNSIFALGPVARNRLEPTL